MTIFVNFLEKNVKFLAIFWQSNGNFSESQNLPHFGAKSDLPAICPPTDSEEYAGQITGAEQVRS